MCDEDRNFARHYMSLIVKDMRYLPIRRGIDGSHIEEDTTSPPRSQYFEIEGALFKLFKQLRSHFDEEDKKKSHSILSMLDLKESVREAME